jgi:hypothetical protein
MARMASMVKPESLVKMGNQGLQVSLARLVPMACLAKTVMMALVVPEVRLVHLDHLAHRVSLARLDH